MGNLDDYSKGIVDRYGHTTYRCTNYPCMNRTLCNPDDGVGYSRCTTCRSVSNRKVNWPFVGPLMLSFLLAAIVLFLLYN